MILANPFPLDVRWLYADCWACWTCGANGVNRGGLELHHIFGRISASALNSALLCGYCHRHIGHSTKEQHSLFEKTLEFLWKEHYDLKPIDEEFLEMIKKDLFGFRLVV